MSYSAAVACFQQEQVVRFAVDGGGMMTMELRDGTFRRHALADVDAFRREMGALIEEQRQRGIVKSYDFQPRYELPMWLIVLLPAAAAVVLALAVWMLLGARQQSSQSGGGGGPGMGRFGHARTVEVGENNVTFADVAGADEEKQELQELVDFLKEPQKFIDLGARIPKGVLLVGPPGTGKTLLARAVAGEAGVKFLSISGSDFVELYVGVGASRVRDLFDQAKKHAPAIVFIDEIDAVGRQRGAGLGGGHDEREQTLNQLLVEMDGFAANEGVIVLAATNRQDILDPALLRPGRFDRQIYVGLPDIKGREEILKVHAREKPLAEDVVLKDVAKATAGFTGADLENLLNEAALLAARADRRFILMSDLHEAMLKVIAGPEKRSRVVTEHTRRLTAYHEAGHAVVIHELSTADPVHQITIIPRGQAGGMTISLPDEDKAYQSRQELTEQIARCLGGRVAEQLVLGDISTGAGSDIQRASAIARNMVMRYGMSDKLGSVTFESGHDEVFIGRSMAQAKSYSEEVAALIDGEVRALIDGAYARCEDILTRCRRELEITARYLLDHETMDAETFAKVFDAPQAEELAPYRENLS
ncbi:MAG: ATP-dependent zinc metalloprotease FtsH [Oscillospiraceae bacterium]|nr:ATP-dependent zinc metalloprotease FtsH [Oscillospiraceae bacterium]